jgi:hypothetical protein
VLGGEAHRDLIRRVAVTYFLGDRRKPVLLLYPACTAKVSFVVRLLPTCAPPALERSKLVFTRNNVRPLVRFVFP